MLYIAFLRFLHNHVLLNDFPIAERLWVWGKKPYLKNKKKHSKGVFSYLLFPLRYLVRSISKFLHEEICKHSVEIAKGRLEPHLGGHFGNTVLDEGALIFLKKKFNVKTMIDVGCGPGGQVKLARKLGINAIGVDGDHTLKLNKSHFFLHDFTKGNFPCKQKFDLAWCVEFLEHVEDKYKHFFMDTLKKAKIVFCTTPPPGTIGHHHVNCRKKKYWLDLFAEYGFSFDAENTEKLKECSSMQREYMQNNGMLFVKIK